MVGLLYALPNTQLTRRLEQEGRLFEAETAPEDGEIRGDQCTAGLNFTLLRPRRDALEDYRNVLDDVYAPAAYFARVRDVSISLKVPERSAAVVAAGLYRESGRFLRLMLGITLRRPDMRREMWALLIHVLRHNPAGITPAMRLTALYVHLGPFSRYVIDQIDEQITAIDAGTWVQPPMVDAPRAAMAKAVG